MAYGYRPSWRSANYRYVAGPNDPVATEPRAMKARFAGKCETCQGQILPGEDMLWIPATRKARHATCPTNPTPVQATPQIACPKCGQMVYQQMSKYGKPYFTNTANRQDFHPCRVWTGRRKRVAPVNTQPIPGNASSNAVQTANATPSGAVPSGIVSGAVGLSPSIYDWVKAHGAYVVGSKTSLDGATETDVRTWTAVERDLAEIDKQLAAMDPAILDPTNGESDVNRFNTLVSDREQCLNRLALLTWERIRYDS